MIELTDIDQVIKACLSADLRCLVSVLRYDREQQDGVSMSCYRIVTVDTHILCERSPELRHVATLCGHIGEHISTVLQAVKAMAKRWQEGLLPLKNHLEPLLHQLRCFDRPNTAEQEFFMMLTCGITSGALEKYFSEVSEQTFQKLGRTLDNVCATVENIATNNLLRSTEALVFRLSDMVGLAKWEEKFGVIGLKIDDILALKRAAELLHLKGQETLVWVQDARANFAAFTVWLQSVVRKQNRQDSLHGTESLLDRRQNSANRKPIPLPDIERLIHLLGPCTL